MKTSVEMREEAERCIDLARRTADHSVASALLAYAGELEQRSYLLDTGIVENSRQGPLATRHATGVAYIFM